MKFKINSERIIGNFEFGPLEISPNEFEGFRPYQLFVSAIAGCSGNLLRTILTKKRHPFDEIEMETTVKRNPKHANRIETITIVANVITDRPIVQVQAEKLTNLVLKNCGMIQSIANSIDINFIIQS